MLLRTLDFALTVGRAGLTGDWKDQNFLSDSLTMSGEISLGSASLAPAAIQALIFSVSASVASSTAKALASLAGGISPFTMRV